MKLDEYDLEEAIKSGVYDALRNWTASIAFWVLIGLVVNLFVYACTNDRDSTDGEERSGMHLHVDALTGCHYLSGKDGGLTPRLYSDGVQVCIGEEVK